MARKFKTEKAPNQLTPESILNGTSGNGTTETYNQAIPSSSTATLRNSDMTEPEEMETSTDAVAGGTAASTSHFY